MTYAIADPKSRSPTTIAITMSISTSPPALHQSLERTYFLYELEAGGSNLANPLHVGNPHSVLNTHCEYITRHIHTISNHRPTKSPYCRCSWDLPGQQNPYLTLRQSFVREYRWIRRRNRRRLYLGWRYYDDQHSTTPFKSASRSHDNASHHVLPGTQTHVNGESALLANPSSNPYFSPNFSLSLTNHSPCISLFLE